MLTHQTQNAYRYRAAHTIIHKMLHIVHSLSVFKSITKRKWSSILYKAHKACVAGGTRRHKKFYDIENINAHQKTSAKCGVKRIKRMTGYLATSRAQTSITNGRTRIREDSSRCAPGLAFECIDLRFRYKTATRGMRHSKTYKFVFIQDRCSQGLLQTGAHSSRQASNCGVK